QLPGRRVPLTGALLALRRDGHRATGRGDAVVRVRSQRRGVHVDGSRRHETVLVHELDAVVVRRAPHAGVRRHGYVEFAGDCEGRFLRERRVARDVKRHLEAEHVIAAGDATVHEITELRARRPLPGAALDVAVRENEPTGYRLERVNGRVGVLRSLQTM